jgi:transcriptional regulator with XRE-family HTH domain
VDSPGRRLRKTRERLDLKYRDVEEASLEIARRHDNQEFSVGLSRLADIENRGTVPSLYRLYSLCAIYGLSLSDVLSWYGVQLSELAVDAAKLNLRGTRMLDVNPPGTTAVELPLDVRAELDLSKTLYLSPLVKCWGMVPVTLLGALDLRRTRYAFIGTEDWSMYPIIAPGSLVQIDETKKEIAEGGWVSEHERPIHFLEHRDGYRFGWCTRKDGLLILQPHSASHTMPEVFRSREVDVVGQVVGVAMRLNMGKRRHIRS